MRRAETREDSICDTQWLKKKWCEQAPGRLLDSGLPHDDTFEGGVWKLTNY